MTNNKRHGNVGGEGRLRWLGEACNKGKHCVHFSVAINPRKLSASELVVQAGNCHVLMWLHCCYFTAGQCWHGFYSSPLDHKPFGSYTFHHLPQLPVLGRAYSPATGKSYYLLLLNILFPGSHWNSVPGILFFFSFPQHY